MGEKLKKVTNYVEWKAAVTAEHKKLAEVSFYLNDNGKERMRVFNILENLSQFCETPEELLAWIESRDGFDKYDVFALESSHATLTIKSLRKISKKIEQ